MFKKLSWIAGLLVTASICIIVSSCSDNDTTLGSTPEPPQLTVQINKTERTQADFTIYSPDAADYAYIICEKGNLEDITAEELFKTGTTGIIENKKVDISSTDVEGGNEYEIIIAARKINPYVYSDVQRIDFNTNIPYTKLLTLEKIGLTDFTYHVEVPEGATIKHVVIRKNDYEGVKSILGGLAEVTEDIYLKVFGLLINESQDISYDKYGKDASGEGFDIHIHSDNTFLAMAGVVGEDGEIDVNQFECVEFNTRKPIPSPYDIKVATTTTSTTANITITPDPEITHYRMFIDKKSEFDWSRREGEQQVKYLIIGHWDDNTNATRRDYTEAQTINMEWLVPNTQYIVGLVGFDSENRECFKTVEFYTGAPTGTAPTLTVVEASPTTGTMWNSKAYNVKAQNAVEVCYGYWKKSQIDDVLSNGTSMETIIQSNGLICSTDQMSAILSNEGLTFETNNLQPGTEYVFGVYARTVEYVGSSEYRIFTTDDMPQVGGDIRKNMPGNYIATTTIGKTPQEWMEDETPGAEISFPVTITTGVNDETTSDYASKNRLVCLGFGPSDKFPFKSPAETSSNNPNNAYGPKWFIEFTEDGIIMPLNNKESWSMGLVDNTLTYMTGVGVRKAGWRYVKVETTDPFPVEVSEDGNTITIKGVFCDVGSGGYAYPSMTSVEGSGWSATYNYHFMCGSDLVLTRQTNKSSLNAVRPVKKSKIVKIRLNSDTEIKSSRTDIAEKLK